MLRTVSLSRHALHVAIALLIGISSPVVLAQTPLDVVDPTPRTVFVQVENSLNLATVGASFGSLFPATYSASGNTGTLTISASTHEQMRGGFPAPVPGSFTPIEITIDLTTFEAISSFTSGSGASGPITSSFGQGPLSSTSVAGFMGPDVSPLYCDSQADVDLACMFVPMFCGQTCTLVSGANYNPLTGLVNLVGAESQSGCDGAMCSGPFSFFTPRGDLRLTEAAMMDAVDPRFDAAIALAIGALAVIALARAHRKRSAQ